MRKFTTAILATAAAISSVSCKKDLVGEGPVTTETRTIANFAGIDLRMNGNVFFTRDATVKVEVTAPQSIHSMLETSVVDNRLVIRYSNGKTYDADDNIRINVSGPDMNAIMLNTSGSIYCMNEIHPANLYLRTTGSGNISLQQVNTNAIDASSTMSGRITATGGTAVSEKMKIDGSGKIDLSAIAAKTASAHIVGSGDIKLKVADNLSVTIEGSGSVYFSGNPFISTHISGSGHLVRL